VRSHHERGDGSGYPDGLVMEDVAMPVRIIGLADTFDAMTSERPYRESLSVGSTLSEIVRLSPQKFDSNAVHGLLLQIRRDAVGSNRVRFFEDRMPVNIAAGDIDQLAATLQHKVTHGRLYLT
jgi:HD-GYP domain-containing protein (c-di-GMP phosphodiesterase class II)